MATIVISGVSKGIGYALVCELLKSADHTVIGISGSAAPPFCDGEHGGQYKHVHAPHGEKDVFSGLENLLDDEGLMPDALVNNAGMMLNKPWNEISQAEAERIFQVNVIRPFMLIRRLLPRMAKPGHIVNITSMGGVMGSVKFPGLSLYSASKGALSVLTEALAEELKESGVHVNGIAPGAVQTEMLQEAFPGYKAPVSAQEFARFLAHFTLTGHTLFNGKVLPVAVTTP